MCGITAIYSYRDTAPPVDRDELRRIRDHMTARGPDGSGEWFSDDGRVALGHRRLAIIDLDARAAQPMASSDGSHVIAFNGEIYNFRALRAELESLGHRFRTESDTEVLLAAYRQWADGMHARLRGMYAFALWDGVAGRLVLARDAYGIKPLYYADDGATVRVASQVKALLAGGGVDRAASVAGWAGFLLFGSVPEPLTVHEAIRHVPAGSVVVVDGRGVVPPALHTRLADLWRAGDAAVDVSEALRDSVRHHLVSDVPVGVFLSAGVDSSAILGLAAELGAKCPHSVTIAFDEFRGEPRDEAPLANAVARHYGSHHVTYRVSRAEFDADLPRILEAMDQPTIDGVNTWFVAKAARELGWKVALSGLGGDELFGGYPSFADVPRWRRWFAWSNGLPRFGRAVGSVVARLTAQPKAAGLLSYGGTWAGAYYLRRGLFMPWELSAESPFALPRDRDFLAECLAALERLLEPALETDHARVAVLESGWYMRNQLLRDTDWASMAHSIEVRVPLVDVALTRAIAAARRDIGKSMLAAAPSRPLPHAVTQREKTGFETPIRDWAVGSSGASAQHWSRGWARRVFAAQSASLASAA